MLTPKEIALLAAKALDSKKGLDIKVLETGHLTTLADRHLHHPDQGPGRRL